MQSPQAQEVQAPFESQAMPTYQDDTVGNGQQRTNTFLAHPGPSLLSAQSRTPSPYRPAQLRQLDDGAYSRDGDAIDSTSEGRLPSVETSNDANTPGLHPDTSRAHSTTERRLSQHQDVPSSILQSSQNVIAYGDLPLNAERELHGYPDRTQGGSPSKATRDVRRSVDDTAGAPTGKDWAQLAQSSSLSSEEPATIGSAQLAEKTLPNTPDAYVAPVRKSKDSEGTYYTADTSGGKAVQTQPVPHIPVTSTVSQEVDSSGPSGFGMASSPVQIGLEQGAISNGVIGNSGIRPFSFIDTSQYQLSQLVPDVERRAPSVGDSFQRHPDQLPLLNQHQRSSMIDEENGRAPVYYGPEHDFSNQEEEILPARTRSFSRPFHDSPRRSEDPNIRHHPAFRQEPLNQNETDQAALVSGPIRHDEASLPTQKRTEDNPDIEPPDIGETQNKRRSWRGSRTSGIFKGPSNFPLENDSSSATPIERLPPVITAGDATKKQSRRASLFRSLTGRSGSDPDRDVHSRKPSLTEHLRDSKDRFNQSRRGSQRNVPSAAVERDGSKKKRFSSMGVSS